MNSWIVRWHYNSLLNTVMTLSSETVLQYKNMIPCKSTIAKEKKKGLSPFSMGAFNDRLCI